MGDEGLGMPMGERLGPDDVSPVTMGDTGFEVIHWGRARGLDQNGGYLAAYDVSSGNELWSSRFILLSMTRKWKTMYRMFLLKVY